MTQSIPFGTNAATLEKGQELTLKTADDQKAIHVIHNEIEGTWVLAVSDQGEQLSETQSSARQEVLLRMTHDSHLGNAIIASLDPAGHMTVAIVDSSPPGDSAESKLCVETLIRILDQSGSIHPAAAPEPDRPALQQGIIKV